MWLEQLLLPYKTFDKMLSQYFSLAENPVIVKEFSMNSESDSVGDVNSIDSETQQPIVPPTQNLEQEQVSPFEMRFAGIEAALLELKGMFEQRIQYDEVKDKAFDKLYDKMKEAESGFQASLKESMIRSLLLLYDSMVSTEQDFSDKKMRPETIQQITSLRQELISVLYSEDVELIEEDEGGKFDRHKQQALRTVPTHYPDKDYSIEEVVREGFTFRGKVLRPQSVVVRRYDASASEW
jgi:molecular chaperone GrpE (heat shock protein)